MAVEGPAEVEAVAPESILRVVSKQISCSGRDARPEQMNLDLSPSNPSLQPLSKTTWMNKLPTEILFKFIGECGNLMHSLRLEAERLHCFQIVSTPRKSKATSGGYRLNQTWLH